MYLPLFKFKFIYFKEQISCTFVYSILEKSMLTQEAYKLLKVTKNSLFYWVIDGFGDVASGKKIGWIGSNGSDTT